MGEDMDGLLMKCRVSFKTSYYDIRTLCLGKVIVDKVMGTGWTSAMLSPLPQWWVPSQSVADYCLEYVLKLAVSKPSAVSLSLQCWQRKILPECKQSTKLITEKRGLGRNERKGGSPVHFSSTAGLCYLCVSSS